jgi:hypothetical protein
MVKPLPPWGYAVELGFLFLLFGFWKLKNVQPWIPAPAQSSPPNRKASGLKEENLILAERAKSRAIREIRTGFAAVLAGTLLLAAGFWHLANGV